MNGIMGVRREAISRIEEWNLRGGRVSWNVEENEPSFILTAFLPIASSNDTDSRKMNGWILDDEKTDFSCLNWQIIFGYLPWISRILKNQSIQFLTVITQINHLTELISINLPEKTAGIKYFIVHQSLLCWFTSLANQLHSLRYVKMNLSKFIHFVWFYFFQIIFYRSLFPFTFFCVSL